MFLCDCAGSSASSTRSTLSLMKQRSHKYQRYLNLGAVILLVASIVLIFTAIILMKFYQIEKLDFWSQIFYIVPIYMIILGLYIFLISFFGIGVSGLENRCLLITYAILQAIAFLAQIGSIFVSLELRKILAQETSGAAAVNEDLKRYGIDPYVTHKWDAMQRYLHCCGGNNHLTGYTDYRVTPFGSNYSVPDSCCFEPFEGCGRNVFQLSDIQIRQKIFVHGCLTLLKNQIEDEVLPILIAYASLGVFLALIQLISVVLCSAYVAQISRKIWRERQQIWSNGKGNPKSRILFNEEQVATGGNQPRVVYPTDDLTPENSMTYNDRLRSKSENIVYPGSNAPNSSPYNTSMHYSNGQNTLPYDRSGRDMTYTDGRLHPNDRSRSDHMNYGNANTTGVAVGHGNMAYQTDNRGRVVSSHEVVC